MGRAGKGLRRLWRWLAGAVAALALLAALGVGVFRLAIELLPGYQQQIADQIRAATGLRLEFDALNARIGRYGPEIQFSGARVLPASGDEPLVSAESGGASLAIGRSLWYRRIEVGRVVLVRPRLHFVIRTDGSVELVGQGAIEPKPGVERQPMTLARLPRGLFAVHDATLDVLDLRAKQGRFELTGADLEFERSGKHVSLRGQVELPEHLGSALEVDADLEGDLDHADSVEWRASIDARDLDLEQWAELLPDSIVVPAAGHGSVHASARGVGRDLSSLRLRPDLTNLQLPDGGVEFTRVAGDLHVQRNAEGITIEGTGLEISREGMPWRPTSVSATLKKHEDRIVSVAARADYLRIENLAAFSSLLPAGPLREKLVALAPRGELFGLDATVENFGAGGLPDINGRARFVDIGFEPFGRALGLQGLDGAIEGRGAGGIVRLATRDGLVSWPLQWRALAELPSVDGRIEWNRFGDGVRLWVDEAAIDTGHGIVRGKLRVAFQPGQLPLMDLNASIEDFDATQIWRTTPIEHLQPKALGWLDAAFRAGRIVEGTVSQTGPTRGFPYREGQGRFHAEARVKDVTLFYASGWPEIRGLDAEIVFDGPAMHVVATRGSLAGIAIAPAEANSADYRESIIALRASARGDAGRAIRMLQDSPLAPSLGAGFADLTGSGPVTGELTMYLPIKDFEQRIITVMTRLDGIKLQQRQQAVEASDLKGVFWVRNREIEAPALTGQFLGGPLQVSIRTTTQKNGDLSTLVSAQGTVAAEPLRPVARLPVNAGISGTAAWRGFLTVERSADREIPARGTLRLSSDLRGFASKLPEPFSKTADAARPLTVTASFGGEGGPRIQAQLGRDVHALLQWRSKPEDPPIERGILSFGASAPTALPRAAGLWLTGRLDSASISDLVNLKWDQPRGRPLDEWLGGADLTIQRLEVLGYAFANANGRMRPGNQAWEIDVNSEDATGHLTVPHTFPGDVPMVLNLDRLHFGESVRSGEGEPDPRQLPAIQVDIRDLQFEGRQYGHLQAELARGMAGMTLNQFTMKHAAFEAKGSGSWLVRASGAECRLEFEVESGNVLAFMNAMQLGSLVAGSHGRISANLSWPGPPESSAIERLSGRLEIAAEDGRLTSVEPGAGRVLGLMSIAHLPRRLALDFGDLTGEGLSFDKLRGTFQLTDGEAYTDNLTLRGSAAEIGVAGRTSLRDRTYDQTAVVTGQLGASLGVAGALAGGPVVGAAFLLFSRIFKEPLKGATRGYYRIMGSWDDPQLKRIDAQEMKDTKQVAAPQRAGESGSGPSP
ncbi:MAG: TIGR02099 family protein [Gammaproteobacteria bacterium]|nr:TIGR02099 family protein [Gammaproteobacteria bacterium]